MPAQVQNVSGIYLDICWTYAQISERKLMNVYTNWNQKLQDDMIGNLCPYS